MGILGGASDIRTAIKKAISENADLRQQVEEFVAERTAVLAHTLIENAKEVNGIKVVELTGIRLPDVVKNVAFTVRKESPAATVFIAATENEDKPLLTVMVTDDLVKSGLSAAQTVREAAKLIKGGGGGQPFFAQAGGKNKDGLSAAFDKIKEILNLK